MMDCPSKTSECSKENCDRCCLKRLGHCGGCPFYYALWVAETPEAAK